MEIERYLADGVYAVFDNGAITLDLRGQDDTTVIVLDEETINELTKFIDVVYGR